MSEINYLSNIKEALHEFSNQYKNIVKQFDDAVIDIESTRVTTDEKIKIKALEIRCKDSQYLLEEIISQCRLKEHAGVNQYAHQVENVLTDIRQMLSNNDLMGMIKCLEKIPPVMMQIDQDLTLTIAGLSQKTLH